MDSCFNLPVSPGMPVEVEALASECIDISEYLRSQNLINLLSVKDKCYDGLVREFYANSRANKDKSVVRSVVRNIHVEVSTEVLFAEFGLVDTGYSVDYKMISAKNMDKLAVPGYDDREFVRQILQHDDSIRRAMGKKPKFYAPDMKVLPRLLHLIICHNIVPKGGSISSVSALERIMLWHLLNKKPLNIGKLMIATIFNKIRKIRSRDNKKTHLPFGIFLTSIFRRFNVPIYTGHIDKGFHSHNIGVSYFKKMAVKSESQGWMWKKFKPADAVLGDTAEQDKITEAANQLVDMGECAAVDKPPFLGQTDDVEDVVIVSQQTRAGATVC